MCYPCKFGVHENVNLWNHNRGFIPRIVNYIKTEWKDQGGQENIFLKKKAYKMPQNRWKQILIYFKSYLWCPYLILFMKCYSRKILSSSKNCPIFNKNKTQARKFQHIFITKKLCIHIEFWNFWLLKYLKIRETSPKVKDFEWMRDRHLTLKSLTYIFSVTRRSWSDSVSESVSESVTLLYRVDWCDPGEWRYPLKTLLMRLW